MSAANTPRPGRAPKDRGQKSQPLQTASKISENIKHSDGMLSKVQPTAEQMRLAQIINLKLDDPDIKSKIEEITRVTGKSCDEALVALHDCDNDTNRAANLLMDGIEDEGKWETSCKKKKNRQTGQKVTEVNGHDSAPNEKEEKDVSESAPVTTPNTNATQKRDQKQRDGGYRYRGPPRMNRGGNNNNRNWRNKDHNERGDRNQQDGRRERIDRGDRGERNSESRARGPRHGRGRGGRSRTFQNRKVMQNDGFPESIDTWTNSTAEKADNNNGGANTTMTVGNWSDVAVVEDWSEEDWTETLTETKVFTPSSNTQSSNVAAVDLTSTASLGQKLDLASLLQGKPMAESSSNSLANNSLPQAQGSLMSQQMVSQMSQPVAQSGQSHFDFNQFAKQAAETIKAAVGVVSVQNSSASTPMNNSSFQSSGTYQSNYGVNHTGSQHHGQMSHDLQGISTNQSNYNSGVVTQPGVHMSHDMHSPVVSQQSVSASSAKPVSTSQHQPLPQRVKPHKARLPPPSKIPESAVVMPDDAVMSLDVQFGALQFGADSSPFDFTAADNTATYQDLSANSNTSSHVASQSLSSTVSSHSLSNSMPSSVSMSKDSSYVIGSHGSLSQNNISKELAQSQKVSGQDSLLLSQVDHNKPVDSVSSYVNHRTNQSSNLDASVLNSKPDQPNTMSSYNSSSHDNSSSYSSVPYGSQKSSVLNSSSLVPSTVSYSSHTSALSGGPTDLSSSQQQSKFQSGQASQSQNAAYVSGSNSYANFNLGYNSSGAYGSNNSGYSTQQGYNSGSVTASTQGGAILSTTVASSKLTNSLSHAVKDSSLLDLQHNSAQSPYDTSTTTVSGVLTSSSHATSTTNHSAQNASNMNTVLGLVTSTASSTPSSVLKSSASSGKTNIPNIPQGVPAAMLGHQYIMSQTGLPFYGLQQPMYSYEDVQLMQSKTLGLQSPVYSYEDMQTLQSKISALGYYDMQFQPPTSMTGRDSGLGSMAYTATDGKYSRADTDASTVVTTLSQGQGSTPGHSQPFINTALPPGYSYYIPGMMTGGIHHYAPHIFPVPPASNTHGATTNTQFQKAAAYGSHSYGSGYENLTQTQDFSKGTYGTTSQNQVKGVSAGSGADLSSSVYSKTHAQLAKSYDKPGFHTGTPPPFNMGNQAAGPSTQYAAHQFIPVIAAHGQHHSTLLHHLQDTAQTGSAAPTGQRAPQGLGQQKNNKQQSYAYWPNN